MFLIRRPIVEGGFIVASFGLLVIFAAAAPAAAPPPPERPWSRQSEPALAAEAPPRLESFAKEAAYDQLSASTLGWDDCLGPDGGAARVLVTFAPTGSVESALVEGAPFAGTTTGECIASKFRDLAVAPFAGASQTLAIVVVKPAPDPGPTLPR